MFIKEIFMGIVGISSGLMVASGVFTVLFVVGLVPRFAGKTNTAKYEIFYEECIIAGSIIACMLSVIFYKFSLEELFKDIVNIKNIDLEADIFLNTILTVVGVFWGIFVGCLAIALAEVLDGIPIFTRRIRLRKGLSIIMISVALGKMAGALLYFIGHFW